MLTRASSPGLGYPDVVIASAAMSGCRVLAGVIWFEDIEERVEADWTAFSRKGKK